VANVITELYGARSFEVYASAARTAAPSDTMEFQSFGRANGLLLVLSVTGVTATPLLTVTISGVDRAGTTWTVLSNTTAIGTTGTRLFRVRPCLTAVNTDPNYTVNDVLPSSVRIACTHGDSDSITYSLTGQLVY
jgi:hypothetical protein